jgi:tight adherence protein C
MNTALIILVLVVVVALIALRLLALRTLSSRPPASYEKTDELTESALERTDNSRFRLSSALFYFAPWLERAIAPSDAASAELLGRQSTRHLEASAKRLLLAGVPGGLSPNEWLGIRYLAGTLGAVVGFLVTLPVVISGHPITATEFFAVVLMTGFGALLGYILPDFWLSRRIRARQRAIVRMIPEMLDLLTISIQAGLGLDAALSRVTERLEGPLPNEFRRALLEIRLGKTRREALRNILSRTDSRPLTNLISGIIQAEQLGVPISRVLILQSEQLRIEQRQRIEEQAAQASIKMLFPIIGCMFPAIWAVTFAPLLITMLFIWPGIFAK